MVQQREVQDEDNVLWVCVQSLTGGGGALAEAAAERLESAEGTVPVVCTPSGGTSSVHIRMSSDWQEQASHAQLLRAIAEARKA